MNITPEKMMKILSGQQAKEEEEEVVKNPFEDLLNIKYENSNTDTNS